MLKKLNTTLCTSYTLETPGLSSLLDGFITKSYDFGMAYAYLRLKWYDNLSTIEDSLHAREARDQEMRRDVLDNETVICGLVPPRRVWDLYSNRVIPWWASYPKPWGISHAWMDERDQETVWTPINGYEWPIPIPHDANLDLIRIEMLNEGAEYAWLDVLCLRQEGGPGEHLRAEEWKLDVPTIGFVYREAWRVVCYFSGLGWPLSFKSEGDFEHDWCWFRRAWTLQEIKMDLIKGGKTDTIMEEDIRVRFDKELSLLQSVQDILGRSVFGVLSLMQNRVSTNPMDKVAGLAYLLEGSTMPAYDGMQNEENAWTAFVNECHPLYKGQMLFLYPAPGNEGNFWRPSWKQAITEKLPSGIDPLMSRSLLGVDYVEEMDVHYCEGSLIESGYVQGLDQIVLEGQLQWGELVIEDDTDTRMKHVFKILTTHQYVIPEGSYTLLGNKVYWEDDRILSGLHWVVGERLPDQRFKKLSVFQMPDQEERLKLKNLDIAEQSCTLLS
ncbi:hypothetical protein DFS33DRAFT_1509159 [Desarmillaria ectypa]|nr:hypothetical protein DFS33DRAFT_1509159 [Desarmillaria ectypa]